MPRTDTTPSAVADRLLDVTPTAARIRAAAVALFAERGYSATGIRDIAKASGVTTASLYHYVDNKEELLVDVMRSSQLALNAAAEAALDGVERPEARLAVLVGGLVAMHARNPLSTRVADIEIRSLAHSSDARAAMVALRDEYEALWRSVLAQGRDEGIFDSDDDRLTRLALIAMCTGMSEWYRPQGERNLVHIIEHFVDLSMAAVHARRGRRRIGAADVPMIDLGLVSQLPWEPAR